MHGNNMGHSKIFRFLFLFGVIFQNSSPVAGKLVKYTLVVSYMEGYPDGVYANFILAVNNSFPGPCIEATEGDSLEITVINEVQDGQNITLHWHGIHQRNSLFEDGVGMITQCPLAAGHKQVYRFDVDQPPGTYWYHSHYRSQYTEGLFGAMIIHAKQEVHAYYGEAHLILSDWYHKPALENERWYMGSQLSFGQIPWFDSVLVNGMGKYSSCPQAIFQNLTCRSRKMMRPVIRIERGKVYRLRLINAASRSTFHFSISEHELSVIEADGVDAELLTVNILPISEGQRYSVLVRCPDKSTNGSRYLIRANVFQNHKDVELDGIVNINRYIKGQNPNGTAILECTDDDLSNFHGKSEMTSEHHGWVGDFPRKVTIETEPGSRILGEMDLSPYNPDANEAPEHVDESYMTEVTFLEGYEDDIRRPGMNYTPFTYPQDKPLLYKLIYKEEFTNDFFFIKIKHGSVVQLILNNGAFQNPHPFHLHGHHFWMMGIGEEFDGDFDPLRHNLTRKGMKRDTLFVPSYSWAVIRFIADNPGCWLFHCHLDWHAVGGMAMVFIEGEDYIREHFVPPKESLRVCGAFNNTSNLIKNTTSIT